MTDCSRMHFDPCGKIGGNNAFNKTMHAHNNDIKISHM